MKGFFSKFSLRERVRLYILCIVPVIVLFKTFGMAGAQIEFVSKIPGKAWYFDSLGGVAIDSSENMYVIVSGCRIQKFDAEGTLLTEWGSFGTEDGQFWQASGIAIDSSGNVYVLDASSRARIQKFNSEGVFLKKWGSYGAGDGQFYAARGIAVDSSGNVYVADTNNRRIQKFNSEGVFLKKWGSNGTGDGQFSTPWGIAVDSSGNVYVAETSNHRIQKFNSEGVFLKKWGSNGTGDGQLSYPRGIAVDNSGNVYVVETNNQRVSKFSSEGVFLKKWGSHGTGDGQFGYPYEIAIDNGGNVYVADSDNRRIQKFSSEGDLLANWGSNGSGDGHFNNPKGIAIDSSGNMYVADEENYRIQKFDSEGIFVTKWGSEGTGDGQFGYPLGGVAVDSSGNVYVADPSNNRIQKFDSEGVFLAKWGSYGSGDGQFQGPSGVAVDTIDNVYVVDSYNHRVQKFNSEGVFLAKWGSNGSEDGQLRYPRGIAVDSSGNVYVADPYNYRIQKFSSEGVFLKKWGSYGSGDRQFACPYAVAVDSGGNVYVADTEDYEHIEHHRIQKFCSEGFFMAKWGSYGTGDGQFRQPSGVAVDSGGNVYVADSGNNRIQKFSQGSQVNHAPLLDPIGNKAMQYGDVLTFAINAFDRDDNDILTYSATGIPSGASFNPNTRTFTWQPGYEDAGDKYHITFTVTDSGEPQMSCSEEITITVFNNISYEVIYIDNMNATLCNGCGITQIYSYLLIVNTGNENITAFDIDSLKFTSNSSVDGFGLGIYKSNLGSYSPIVPGEVVGSVSQTNSMLSNLIYDNESFRNTSPSQVLALSINRNSGNTYIGDVYFTVTMEMSGKTVTFQPHAHMSIGSCSVNFISASRTAAAPPASNTPPVLDPIGDKIVPEGESLSFAVSGHDPDPGDILTYSVSDLPDGAYFDSNTRTFIWQPDNGDSGVYHLTFTVTDDGEPQMSDSEEITITVIKAEPQMEFVWKIPSIAWHFNSPIGVAVDSSGNVYVVDSANSRVQKFSPEGVLLVKWGSNGSGDGQFFIPTGIAVDSSGNVYVADRVKHLIQKFSSEGIFLAKWGSEGSGDGQFFSPNGIAIDNSGNVYVADSDNHRIQKFSSEGVFLAKWGSNGSGDGQSSWPTGIAVDSSGNVYVADSDNHRIQKFSSEGVFLAKWGSNGSGDGQFSWPYGIAIDSSGNVYVADSDNNRVQKFSSEGVFLAKWGSNGSGDGQFSYPTDIAVDSSGNVYVADNSNDRIQKFSSEGVFLAKWGSRGSGNEQFSWPCGIAVDSSGNVYVADSDNNRVQKFSSEGVFLAKWGSKGSGDGQFCSPNGMAIDSNGNVYVADTGNHRIQKFSSEGVFLAKWGSNGSGDGQFSYPNGIAVDSSGNVYVADTGNHRIQKFSSEGVFLAKWGSNGSGDGQFYSPNGIAIDSSGNVYVVDIGSHRIQKFSSEGVFLAKWRSEESGDGQIYSPNGIAVDSSGNVYVAEDAYNRIQKFSSEGVLLTKWGSSGSGDGQFKSPRGIAVDSSGNVYVADTWNHRIQKFTPASSEPTHWEFIHGSSCLEYCRERGMACYQAGRDFDDTCPPVEFADCDEYMGDGCCWCTDEANRAPILDPIGNKVVKDGDTLTFTVTASDPDVHDTLTYSATGVPSGASFDPGTRTFTWQPGYEDAGEYLITFTVTDDGEPQMSDSEEVTITVDVKGPQVVSCSPSGRLSPPVDHMEISFNESIDLDSLAIEDISITGPGGVIVPDSITQLDDPDDPARFRIDFPEQRLAGQYQVIIGPQILDLAGNLMNQDNDSIDGEAEEDRFAAGVTILAGLRIVSHTPAEDQPHSVNLMTFTFSQGINEATFLQDDIIMINPAGEQVLVINGPTLVEGTTYQAVFAEQGMPGTYRVLIGPFIENLDGLPMDQDRDGVIGEEQDDRYDASFIIIDVSGPRVLSLSPSGNVKPPVNSLDIVFNEEIDPVSFEAGDLLITGPGGTITPTAITRLGAASFRAAVPDRRLAGVYQVNIGPQITDLAHNPMDQDEDRTNGEEVEDQYVTIFTIMAGPRITDHTPREDQIPPVSRFTLAFSQEINPATFTADDIVITGPAGSVSITDGPAWIEGTIWQTGFAEQTIAGTYHITIGPGIENMAGVNMDQDQDGLLEEEIDDRYHFSFKIKDIIGPHVVSSSPSGNVSPAISFFDMIFDEPVDPESFTLEDVSISGPGGIIIPGSITQLDPVSFRINFPAQTFAGAYRLVIGPQITDLSANPMDQDRDHSNGEQGEDLYTATFSILPSLKVSGHSPSGDQILPVNIMTITFSQEIKAGTFTSADIGITGPAGPIQLTSGPTRIDSTTYRIGFTEQRNIGIYHVYIGPQIESMDGLLIDQDGDCITGEPEEDRYDAWFKIIDAAGPQVVAHSPSGRVKPPISSFDVTFNEAINPSSFIAEYVSIAGPTGGGITPESITPVDGAEQKKFTVAFSPQESEGTYRFIIGAQVLDLAGNPLNQDQDGINGEPYDDRYVGSFSLDGAGPKITGHSLSGIQNVPVQTFDLTFSEAIKPATFIKEAVTVTGPAGKVAISEVKPNPADSTTVFQVKLTPSLTDGTYHVAIAPTIQDIAGNLLDQDQDGSQGEADDDVYSFDFIQQLPDLVVTRIVHPAEGRAARQIDITWTVTNNGIGKAIGQWTDSVYISGDSKYSTDDAQIGEAQFNQSVDPGKTYTRTITITLPDGINGQRWIIVKANSQGISGGLAEQGAGSNNTLVATPPLWITTRPYPDLQVTSVTVPGTLSAGGKATFSWTVENKGNGATSSACWYDKLYLSSDTTINTWDIEVAALRNAEFLAPGEAYTQTQEVTIPGSAPKGSYYVLVKTDADDKVEEFDGENNNVGQSSYKAEVTIPPSSPPYLKVDYFHVPPKVKSGETITVEWKISNTGTQATQYIKGHDITISSDTIYSWTGDTPLKRTWESYPSIPPGGSQTGSVSVSLPSQYAGKYYLFFIPDTRGGGSNVSGKDYGMAEIEIVPPDPPDISISSANIPATAISGQQMKVNWIVKNIGAGSTRSSTWNDAVYLSTDQILEGSDQELGISAHTGVLKASQGYEVTEFPVKVPAGMEGNYYILIKTDKNNSVWENNKDNNVRVSDTPVTISLVRSDLQVETATSSTAGIAGQLITVQWTVINAGPETTAIGNWLDKVYLSRDETLNTQSDKLLGSVPQSNALDPAHTYSRSQDFQLTQGIEGAYYIIIAADADDNLYEYNAENNNTFCIPSAIEVSDPAADLRVESFTVPATGITGQNVQVNWSVTNSGTAAAAGKWKDAVYLSKDTIFDSSDKLLTPSFEHSESVQPGGSYGHGIQREVRVPDSVEGTCYLFLVIDKDNTVYEKAGGEANNISEPQAITLTDVAADLRVESFTASSTGIAGQTIQVDWRVSNLGTVAAQAPWKDAVYLSEDDSLDTNSDTLLRTFVRSVSLAKDAGYGPDAPGEVRLPSNIGGPRYLFFVTDVDKNVYEKESGEANNISSPHVITLINQAADLKVESFTVPPAGIAGQTIQVNWSISNQGTASAVAPWQDKIYLSGDNSLDPALDTLVATFDHMESLATGASYGPPAAPHELLIPALPEHREGEYYLFFCTDADKSVYEKGIEENNVSVPQLITLSEKAADLQVQTASAPANAIANEIIAVSWTITNRGDAPAKGWKDAVYLSEDTVFDPKKDRLCGMFEQTGTLEAGQITGPPIQPAFIRIPDRLTGTYHLLVVTDDRNSVYEKGSGEGNNIFLIPQAIEIALQPADLQVTEVNAPLTAKAGSAITIGWTVMNKGNRDTDETFWKDGVYLSKDKTFDPASDINLGLVSRSGALATGASYSQSESFVVRQDVSGPYHVYVVTDAIHQVFEYDKEDNNTSSSPGTVQVTGVRADLVVSHLTVPTGGCQGQSIEITWTVTNAGPDSTLGNSWDDTVYLSSDNVPDAQDVRMDFKHQGSLAGGASYSVTRSIPLPKDRAGNIQVIVKTDSGKFNDIYEYEGEENNTACASLTVNPAPTPDLRVTTIVLPETAWSGQGIRIEWTVTNEGTVSTSAKDGFWDDTVYLSRDPYLDSSSDLSLGNTRHKGELAAGGTYTQSLEPKLPGWAAGPYYVIVTTDSGTPGHVVEGEKENNNSTVSCSTVEVNLTPPADLVVTSISPPGSGIYGQAATWTYEVKNQGSQDAVGAWYDTLYLSSDQEWNLGDQRIARVFHSADDGDVPQGQSYTKTITADIPAVMPGIYSVLASTDIFDDVRETDEENNTAVSLGQITVIGRELALNMTETGTIAKGQSLYYQITAEAGQDLIITLAGAARENAELYAAYGKIPTRSSYDTKGEKDPSGNLVDRILGARAGVYYILIYGYNCPASPPAYELRAVLPDHSISGLSISEAGNAGKVTVGISGFNFAPGSTVFLKDTAGNIVDTGVVTFKDTGFLLVTFDLTGKPAGSYRIELINPDGSVCSKELNVVQGKGGELYSRLVMPNLVRPGRPYTLTLDYGNIGDADIPAPLMVVTGGQGSFLRLFSTEAFHQNPVQVLGVAKENPVDVLPPGSTYSIEMEFKIDNTLNVPIYLNIVDQLDEPIDWSKVDATLKPKSMDEETWKPIWENIQSQLGNTWGSYIQVLREDARRLALYGERIYDVRKLFGLEVNIAYGGHRGAISGVVYESDSHTPVAGVTIFAYQPGGTGYARAVTNMNGTYLLTGLPEGHYELEVEGYLVDEGASAEVQGDKDCLDHVVYVSPGGEISGYVKDSGIPIKDALISARGKNTGTFATGRTDDEGYYNLKGLPQDVYTVEARVEGYMEEQKPAFFLAKGEMRSDVLFDLVKGAEISGKVTDEGGHPIEGAYVMATRVESGEVASAMTDENGVYKVSELAGGDWEVFASAEGFLKSKVTIVNVVVSGSATQDFSLVLGASVSGMVVDSNGKPIVGAAVFAQGPNNSMGIAATNESGYFQIVGLYEGIHTIRVEVGGFIPSIYESTSLVLGQVLAGMNFQLRDGVSVKGLVTEPDSTTPVSGASITFKSNSGAIYTLTSEGNGIFIGDQFAPDVYSLSVEAEGYCTAQRIIKVPVSGIADGLVISLTKGISLSGTITAADKVTPLSNTWITLKTSNGVSIAEDLTGDDGKYKFINIPPADYSVSARHESYSFKTQQLEGSGGGTFNLDFIAASGALNGIIRNAETGEPIADALVTVILKDSGSRGLYAITQGDGKYNFSSFVTGEYWIVVQAAGFACTTMSTSIREEETIAVDVNVSSGISLSGMVNDEANGQPIPSAIVSLVSTHAGTDDPGLRVTTDDAGNYLIEGIQPGTWEALVQAPGYTPLKTSLTIESSMNYTFVLDKEGFSISVNTVDESTGLPIAEVEVLIYSGNTALYNGLSNSVGVFTSGPLKDGTYSIQACRGIAKSTITILIEDNTELSIPLNTALLAPGPAWIADDNSGLATIYRMRISMEQLPDHGKIEKIKLGYLDQTLNTLPYYNAMPLSDKIWPDTWKSIGCESKYREVLGKLIPQFCKKLEPTSLLWDKYISLVKTFDHSYDLVRPDDSQLDSSHYFGSFYYHSGDYQYVLENYDSFSKFNWQVKFKNKWKITPLPYPTEDLGTDTYNAINQLGIDIRTEIALAKGEWALKVISKLAQVYLSYQPFGWAIDCIGPAGDVLYTVYRGHILTKEKRKIYTTLSKEEEKFFNAEKNTRESLEKLKNNYSANKDGNINNEYIKVVAEEKENLKNLKTAITELSKAVGEIVIATGEEEIRYTIKRRACRGISGTVFEFQTLLSIVDTFYQGMEDYYNNLQSIKIKIDKCNNSSALFWKRWNNYVAQYEEYKNINRPCYIARLYGGDGGSVPVYIKERTVPEAIYDDRTDMVYFEGDEIEFNAEPEEGYQFDHWQGPSVTDGIIKPDLQKQVILVTKDISATAIFRRNDESKIDGNPTPSNDLCIVE
ncbi:MAG: CARDB domain-containing protein [bacterium]